MKKARKQRSKLLALLLTLVLILTAVCGSTSYESYAASNSKKVAKISVKTTSTILNEGQVLTKSMLKKSVKVTAKLKNGKTKKNYTSYTCKQIGKTIKPNSKGKYKVTIKAGSKKKSVSIKVNRIKKIYVKKCSLKLTEGETFDKDKAKKLTTIYADYKKGKDKKLTTFTVSAPSTVTANSNGEFVVTFKYGSKKTTVALPVEKKPNPGGTTPTEVSWLYFYDYKYRLYPEDLDVGILIALDLPQEYSNIDEWGFIYTTDNVNNNDIVFGNASTNTVYEDHSTNKNQKSSHTLSLSEDKWNAHAILKVRIFAKVKKGEQTEIVHSKKILSFKLE